MQLAIPLIFDKWAIIFTPLMAIQTQCPTKNYSLPMKGSQKLGMDLQIEWPDSLSEPLLRAASRK